ncbi:MAG: DUF1127 domain-containing protein [Cucumibacter sp.]
MFMAYMPHSERPALAALIFAPIEGLAKWFSAMRKNHASQTALLQLGELPDARLDDLGLTPQDVYEARKLDPLGVMSLLYERRDHRARNRSRSY